VWIFPHGVFYGVEADPGRNCPFDDRQAALDPVLSTCHAVRDLAKTRVSRLSVSLVSGHWRETVVAESPFLTHGLPMNENPHIAIQKFRLRHGWSQEQLATLSGLSVRTIQRLERGNAASPETLKAVATVFEIDFSQLRTPTMEPGSKLAVSNEEELAFRKVRKIRGFSMHLAQYLIVVSILSAYNLIYMPHYFWAGWTIFGWGTGILIHGLRVFDRIPFLNGDWERMQVEKYLGRKL
jgi:transcriptional regulator with XRE-family HTH domain